MTRHSTSQLLPGALLLLAACTSTTTVEPPPPSAPPTEAPPACTPPIADPADCDAPLVPGADRSCTLTIAGKKRSYLVYAPKSYDPCKPAALVVDAHGATETAVEHSGKEAFEDWPGGFGSGFRLVADREGFVVVQPQGIGNVWAASDTAFMLEIPKAIGANTNLDPARVYLSGISNGGQLTYLTGCDDPGVYTAFAPVSGFGRSSCSGKRRAPLIHFHSPDDAVIPLANGKSAFDAWVTGHNCKEGPKPSVRFGGPSSDARALCFTSTGGQSPTYALDKCSPSAPVTKCEKWTGCDGDTTAIFCTVPPDTVNRYETTGGHILYFNATNLSLAAVAWEFFEQRL